MANNAEVVRNEKISQIQFLLQIFKHVDNLRLNRNVQSRNRFVADDEFRVDGKRPCDSDTLTLAAGKFVRITVCVFAVESDGFKKRNDSVTSFLLV